MSNRISVVRGTDKITTIDLVDAGGQPMTSTRLEGAVAKFLMREQPTDVVNVLSFGTDTTPSRLTISALEATITLAILAADNNALAIQGYFYQLRMTLADGEVVDVIPWAPIDVVLGGSAEPPAPVFDATVKIDHDYMLPGDLAYKTAGGSPIENAQIRVYLRSQYDIGQLNTPVGITTTDARGNWKQSLLVAPGYDYVLRFEKVNEYGPDVKYITAV